jgi:hypothetical protein
MARLDLAALPWPTLAAYFVPALAFLFTVYLWQRRSAVQHGAAAPVTRTITATYGNAVQMGIPMAAALYGEPGLAVHIALVSLHGLVLLTVLTVLVETDLARQDQAATIGRTALTTARNTIVHPVVLPVLAGLAWNFTGIGLHPAIAHCLEEHVQRHHLGQAGGEAGLIGIDLMQHLATGIEQDGGIIRPVRDIGMGGDGHGKKRQCQAQPDRAKCHSSPHSLTARTPRRGRFHSGSALAAPLSMALGLTGQGNFKWWFKGLSQPAALAWKAAIPALHGFLCTAPFCLQWPDDWPI